MTEATEFSRVPGISGLEKESQILPEVTPHQKLLGKMLGEEQCPISKTREKELRDVLDKAIDTLTQRHQTVLNLRFGLKSEPRKTHKEIGRVLNVSSELISRIEAHGITKLRNYFFRTSTHIIEEYLSIPRNSVARRIAGLPLTTKGEFKIFEGMDLSEFGVAVPWVQYVARQLWGKAANIKDLLLADAKPYIDNLDPKYIKNLKAVLGRIYEKAQARQRLNIDREKGLFRERIKFTVGFGNDEKKSVAEERQYKTEEQHKNVFMPELPEEIVSKIWDKPLDILFDNRPLSVGLRNCLVRAGIMTIGAILEMSEEHLLLNTRSFGVRSLRRLQSALVEHTNILQEKV